MTEGLVRLQSCAVSQPMWPGPVPCVWLSPGTRALKWKPRCSHGSQPESAFTAPHGHRASRSPDGRLWSAVTFSFKAVFSGPC